MQHLFNAESGRWDQRSLKDQIVGALHVVGGTAQALFGAALCTTGIGCVAGAPFMAFGVNNVMDGAHGVNVIKDGFVMAGDKMRVNPDYSRAAYTATKQKGDATI
jgi:TctA family transporter